MYGVPGKGEIVLPTPSRDRADPGLLPLLPMPAPAAAPLITFDLPIRAAVAAAAAAPAPAVVVVVWSGDTGGTPIPALAPAKASGLIDADRADRADRASVRDVSYDSLRRFSALRRRPCPDCGV